MRFPLIHTRHFGLEILIFKLIVDSFFQQILTSNIKIQDTEVRNCVFFRFIKCFRCIESPLHRTYKSVQVLRPRLTRWWSFTKKSFSVYSFSFETLPCSKHWSRINCLWSENHLTFILNYPWTRLNCIAFKLILFWGWPAGFWIQTVTV